MMPKSLLEISVKYLHDHTERYNRDDLSRILGSLDRIRGMLLERFYLSSHESCAAGSNCINRFWSVLPLLLKSTITELDLSNVVTCRNSAPLSNSLFQELIWCLPSITPNLVDLKISNSLSQCHPKLVIGEKEALSIIGLTRLSKLSLGSISMTEFLNILHQCRHLQDVAVRQITLDVEPRSALISDSFVGQHIDASGLRGNCFSWTLSKGRVQNEIIGLRLAPKKIVEFSLVRKLSRIVFLKVNLGELEDENELRQFPCFPCLREAHFNCKLSSGNAMKHCLARNGRTLRCLVISNLSTGLVTYEQIFNWCPELQNLEVYNSIVTEAPVPPESSFDQLAF